MICNLNFYIWRASGKRPAATSDRVNAETKAEETFLSKQNSFPSEPRASLNRRFVSIRRFVNYSPLRGRFLLERAFNHFPFYGKFIRETRCPLFICTRLALMTRHSALSLKNSCSLEVRPVSVHEISRPESESKSLWYTTLR